MSRFRISQKLLATVLMAAGALAALWLSMLLWLVYTEVESRKQSLMHSAETIMNAADAEIGRFAAVASTIVASRVAGVTNLDALEREARAVSVTIGDAWLLLARPDGQQIFNTYAKPGENLPMRGPKALLAQGKACETGRLEISEINIGPVSGKPVITVNHAFPVKGECYVLAVVFPATAFTKFMDNLPENWLAGIIDAGGRYVARSLDNERLVGEMASAGWIRTRNQTGIHEYKSREGVDLVTANVASPSTGWGSSVAVEKSALYAPFYRSALLATIGGLAVIAACLLAVAGFGRRLAVAVAIARSSAMHLDEPHFELAKTGEPDIDEIIDAQSIAAKRIAKHDESMRLAAQEVNHRAKNLLAVIASFARFIGKDASSAETFRERLNDRLQALALSQDVLIANEWKGGDLESIVRAQVQPFAGGRLKIDGCGQFVPAEAVQSVSLLFHELATNAAKHGALAQTDGSVDLSWSVTKTGKDGRLQIVWKEIAMNASPSSKRGFGSVVIQQSCGALGGTPKFDFRPDGLLFEVELNLDRP